MPPHPFDGVSSAISSRSRGAIVTARGRSPAARSTRRAPMSRCTVTSASLTGTVSRLAARRWLCGAAGTPTGVAAGAAATATSLDACSVDTFPCPGGWASAELATEK